MAKTVLITGAGSGIGLATAKKFLSEGYTVIGTSREGEIPELKTENFHDLRIDLANPESIKEAAKEVESKFNNIDILINNAGILIEDEPFSIEVLRKTLEVNLFGLIDFSEQIIPLINNGGRVLNTSSGMSSLVEQQGSNYGEYQISKTALNKYTQVLAVRLKSSNIQSASFSPGWVRTNMGGEEADRSPEEVAQEYFDLAMSDFESGQFYYQGRKRNW